MKIPITKFLAKEINFLTSITTIVFVYILWEERLQKTSTILIMLIFGIPTILLSIPILFKKFQFKEIEYNEYDDVRKITYSTFFVLFKIGYIFFFGGICLLLDQKDYNSGIIMLIVGIIITGAISYSHEKGKLYIKE